MSDPNVLIDYIPAQLHEGKRWYIDYYVIVPGTKTLKRKQIKVNRIKTIVEKRKFCKRLIQNINIKLASGWNPYYEQEAAKSFHTLSQAISAFISDKRELRPDSLRSYVNFLKLFQEWSEKKFGKDNYVINITSDVCVNYMEDMWEKKIGANRYNNYIVFHTTFFNWLIEHKYSKANPFKGIKRKKQTDKIRVMEISEKDRTKIKDYLMIHNRRYLAMVLIAYHSLLRPKEIVYLKGKNINLKTQTIIVEGFFSKNHKKRAATIPDVMLDLLKEVVEGVGENEYIFSRNFKKGKTMLDRREVSRYWNDLRVALKLKKEIQFYSLRDSGIIQKLKDGIDPKTVMELADHSSLEITDKYVRETKTESNKEAMSLMSKF